MNKRKADRNGTAHEINDPERNMCDVTVPPDLRRRLTENRAWFEETFTQERVVATNGSSLRFAWYHQEDSRAAVIIVNGRTEFIEKYIETLRDLSADRLSFAIYDHMGQGDSGRLLEDPQKGHIEDFDWYVQDLGLVIEASQKQFGDLPLHLLCHSMGGTIGWLWCASNPGRIESLILCAPMFGIETGVVFPEFIVESVVRICCRKGLAERYVATTGPYNPEPGFDVNVLTGDQDRFDYNVFLTNELSFAPLGGPTYGWMNEAFLAMRKVRNSASRIDCPVRFLAGSEDRVVTLETIREVAEMVNGKYRVFEQGRHELLMETDEIRNRVLAEVRDALGCRKTSTR